MQIHLVRYSTSARSGNFKTHFLQLRMPFLSSNNVITKGQLISKANCQAIDSPKKQTDEFTFFDLKSCYVVKSKAVRSFFGESRA